MNQADGVQLRTTRIMQERADLMAANLAAAS
jgi:hypothetical protein